MSICSYSKEYTSTSFTSLENRFIYDYMPEATGTAVKVYTYGLFLCQNSDYDFSLETFAKNLKITENEVIDSFKYWEEFGLLSIISKEPFSVKYLPLSYTFNSKPKKIKAEKYTDFSNGLQALIDSRMISTGEYNEYYNIMEIYGIKPEAFLMIVKYCLDIKGKDITYKYISATAKNFGIRKILTPEQVEKELSNYMMRSSDIQRILVAMSLKRAPEVEDLTYFNKWTKELNFEVENIIYSASKVKKGGMKKLDEFILELYSAKCFTKAEIQNYTKNKDNLFELAIKINKNLGVYSEVIGTVVENYTSKWASYGFLEKALLLISNYCFRKNKKTLQEMDNIINYLYKNGLIDFDSITEYFMEISKNDEFISEILSIVGLIRKPNNWDRENLKIWRTWNFSDEMIREASKLSSGKQSPIAYINAILGSWKNKNIFKPEDIIKEQNVSNNYNGNKKPSFDYNNQRKYSEEEISKVIDNISEIEF